MLNLGGLDDLACNLGIELSFLHEVLDDFESAPEKLFEELTLWPADETKKPRDVVSILKPWRIVQERIYKKLFLPWFDPLPSCHGGVRGRSPVTNAKRHMGNKFVFVTDISNFFPSILCPRVRKLFIRKGCRGEVADALTRLCTHRHHLALGLVTSPIIANELMRSVDLEIERFCEERDLSYSRFMDDITISAMFDLSKCHTLEAVKNILERHRFRIAEKKTAYGRFDRMRIKDRTGNDHDELAITGIRIKRRHVDVSGAYARELDRILADHLSLARGGEFDGPLYLQGEVFGRIYHAITVNPGRKRYLLGKMGEMNWCDVMNNAVDLRLVRHRKRLVPRGSERPDCSVELPLSAGAKFTRDYWEQHVYDPTKAPFDVPAVANVDQSAVT